LSFAEIFGNRKLESLGLWREREREECQQQFELKKLELERRSHRLQCGIVCVIVRSAVLVEHRLVTDRQTHDCGIYRASMASRGKRNCCCTNENKHFIRWSGASKTHGTKRLLTRKPSLEVIFITLATVLANHGNGRVFSRGYYLRTVPIRICFLATVGHTSSC